MSYIKFTHFKTNSQSVFQKYLNNEISKEEYAKTEIYFKSEKIAIYSEEQDSIEHKTWLKFLFNPVLRFLGWTIVSLFKNQKFDGYELRRYPTNCKVTIQPVENANDS